MRMRIVVFCLIAGMLATPMDSLAQSTFTNNWTAIATVPSGQKLVIELKSGKKVSGKFGSVSETGVTLARGKKTEDINRSDIRKVFHEKGMSVPKRTLRGAGIGAGVGAVVGLAVGGCDKPNGCFFDRGAWTAAGGIGPRTDQSQEDTDLRSALANDVNESMMQMDAAVVSSGGAASS